jgi:hypothetical protein
MSKLKTTYQESGGHTTNNTPPGTENETQHPKHSGTSGTNHDADTTGESINQGHGHPRNEHNQRGGDGQDG